MTAAPVTGRSLCPERLSLSPFAARRSSSRSLFPRSSTHDGCLFFLSSPGAAAKEGGRSQAPAPLPGGQRGAGPRRDLPTALPGPRPSFPPPASTPPGSATSDPFFSPCGAQQPGGLKRRGPSPASGAVAQLKAIKGLPSARAARAGPGPHLQARPNARRGPLPPSLLPSPVVLFLPSCSWV